MKHKEEHKTAELPVTSHVKTLLKMKKERMSASGLRPLEVVGTPTQGHARSSIHARASNADLISVGIKAHMAGNTEDYFDKNYVKQARMREEDKVEYKQIKNDQVKAVRGEMQTLEKRHLRDQARVKKNFEMMDELLEDLKKWRQNKEENEITIQKKEESKESDNDHSDLYLTELQAMKEEQEAEREAFKNKYSEATKSWKAPSKLHNAKLIQNAKEVVQIREKFNAKKDDFQKLKDIHQFKLKGEIQHLEGKNQLLDKQLQILNKTEKEDEALLSQIDDITSHMQQWEKEISATLEGLTLLEQDQKLKVPKILEGDDEDDEESGKQEETANKVKGLLDGILNDKGGKAKGGITATDPAVQAMLADIESEFESVERLMKD